MRNTKLNATACAALLEAVDFTDTRLLLSLSILALINVMVIVGNCLVIAAVYYSSKLRSVTNFFIVSLAVADLMVGLAVLPFSATWEVFKVWIFGDVWCQVWLAVDVWMCTASILNLCVISLDRYVAVTRPVTYPSIMSTGRAKLLIVGLWVLSFVICFPPLVGWRDTKRDIIVTGNVTRTYDLEEDIEEDDPHCPWKCELTNEAGYVVYSALGSFFIPMFVMLFFYWRIYRAAVSTTRAINKGFRTTKSSKCKGGIGNRFDEQRLTLRIHRGRGSSGKRSYGSPHSNGSNSTTTTGSASASPSPSARGRHEKVKISISHPSSENLSPSVTPHLLAVSPSSPTNLHLSSAVHYNAANGKDATTTTLGYQRGVAPRNVSQETAHLRVERQHQRLRRLSSSSCDRAPTPPSSPGHAGSAQEDGDKPPKLTSKRMGRRNIKAQVKRFRMETKAAKTLGIIVGGFIFCWLPFFTMYLIRAFCHSCIPPLVFSTLFWLGYCNSAINPLIYALFSKDFRFAFKRIICKCLCTKRQRESSRRGSDGSQLQTGGRQFRSASYNTQQSGGGSGGGGSVGGNGGGGCNSMGYDSDPGGDPSDSR